MRKRPMQLIISSAGPVLFFVVDKKATEPIPLYHFLHIGLPSVGHTEFTFQSETIQL